MQLVHPRKLNGRNRVAVENTCWTMTQGSSVRAGLANLATLGFKPESLWDSRLQFQSILKIGLRCWLVYVFAPLR
jgi:hypothetical protein